MTSVLATHEMDFAKELACKVCFLDAGRILEIGPPYQRFGSPKEEHANSFLAQVL